MKPKLTKDLVWAAAKDAAARSARIAGRKYWNEEDYQAAVDAFNRLGLDLQDETWHPFIVHAERSEQ